MEKVEEKKAEGVVQVTLERSMPPGASLNGDVPVKDSKAPGKLRLVNQATVKRTGPHRFEYRETFEWKGDTTRVLGDLKPVDLAEIKAVLPKKLETDENTRALADKARQLAVPVLFGPGDPLLAIGILHPDLAVYRANQKLGTLLVKALEQQFGDKMQPAERKEVARRLIAQTFTYSKFSQPDLTAPALPPAPTPA
jgi:hypothetical protein